MTIRLKITAAVAGTVALVVAAAGFSWFGLESAMGSLQVEMAAKDAIAAAYRLEATGRATMTSTTGYEESAALWKDATEACDTAMSAFLSAAPELLASGAAPEDGSAETLAAVAEKWNKVKTGYTELDPLYVKLGASRARMLVGALGLQVAYERFSVDLASFYEEAELLGAILDRYRNAVLFTANITRDLAGLSETVALGASVAIQKAQMLGLASLGAAIVAALALSLLFGSSLGRRIGRLEGVMRSVAAKDLGARADDGGRDELGRLAGHVNSVLDIIGDFMERTREAAVSLGSVEVRLGQAVREAGDSSGAVVAGSDAAGSGVAELDRSIAQSLGAVKSVAAKVCSFGELAESQAGELARISSAIEEMAASMASVARLTQDRLGVAEKLRGDVAAGAGESESSARSLDAAERELARITEISTMIADVADRTNILSMNAAIESAHAGNAGRGFAVVADEIRKLSDSTSENASGIDGVVKSVTRSIREAVEAASRSHAALEGTKESVDAFVAALREITTAISELAAAVREIRDSVDSIAAAARTIHGDAEIAACDSGTIEDDLETVGLSSKRLVERMDGIRTGISGLFSLVEGLSALAKETGARSLDIDTMLDEFMLPAEKKQDGNLNP